MSASIGTVLADFGAMEANLDAQVQLLRSRVEAELKKPAVLMVTSALPRDGKSLTAYSLVRCFIASGHRAALVSLDRDGTDRDSNASTFGPYSEDGSVVGREQMAAAVGSVRSRYDFTVIDSGVFLHSNAAIALAELVDGILLTVRIGRPQTDDDELLIRTLEHSKCRIVGVVPADEKAIVEFERHRGAQPAPAHARPHHGVERSARSYLLPAESPAK